MIDRNSENDEARAVQEDLARFGFDDPAESWMDRFRAARAPESLGHLGEFDVLHEVARGGQGIVYCARQPGTNRRIAVKRLRAGSLASPEARARFDREIEIASALSHPNIVTIFAVDVLDGQPALAMEWIEGVPVTEWAQEQTIRNIVRMMRRIAGAVEYAHQRGVIHRDLKPSNILVKNDDPYILDFGLAKSISRSSETEHAESNGFVGTLAYASPEQLTKGPAESDVRSDVYALGVVLYQMLTEQLPHSVDEPAAQVIEAICSDHPALPSSFNPSIDDELDAIVSHTLARDRADRYQSVVAFANDLARWEQGEPVCAIRATRGYLLRKFISRHRAACSVAGTITLIVLLFTIVLLMLMREAHDAREVAQHERDVADRVSAYLTDLLSTAGPTRHGGDVSVLELMEEAAAHADAQLADQPAVAAEIYYTIGATYANLWRWTESIPYLERAVELNRAVYGLHTEKVARCLNLLGRAQSNHGYPVSVETQREALEIRLTLYGEDHLLTAESHMRLGYALFHAAKPRDDEEAVRQLELALEAYRRTVGPDHRDISSCLHNYGYFRLTQNRLVEAEVLYAEAIAMLDRLGDPEDPYRIECMHGYTSILNALGRYEEAIVEIESLIPLVEKGYGASRLAPLLRRAAEAQFALGNHEAAARWSARFLINVCDAALEDDPSDAAHVQALKALLTTIEPPHPASASIVALNHEVTLLTDSYGWRLSRGLIAWSYDLIKLGHFGIAESILETVRDKRRRDDGEPDYGTAMSLEGLATIARARNETQTAQDLFREALTICLQRAPNYEITHARLRSEIGECLSKQGRFEEAEPLLIESYDRLRAHHGDRHLQTQRALKRLIEFFDESGQSERAREYREQLSTVPMPQEGSTDH